MTPAIIPWETSLIISIVNRSNSIPDAELQCVIRALNRQIRDDFEPYWSFGAELRLEGKIGKDPDKTQLPELRGDAVLYLWDKVDVADALGYHDKNARGIPYGFVFTELSKKLGENWTVTLSHEALELLGDAQGNLLVQGPHPENPAVEVFHWFEMCDAVQTQTYKIDGIEVSNFLLPLYFTTEEQEGGRNDFLGEPDKNGQTLKSFCAADGGYIGFYNPRTKQHETWSRPNDKKAETRLAVKAKNCFGRGYVRKRVEAPASGTEAHRRVVSGETRVREMATRADDPIKHVVVLMLENRSFDNMLGGFSKVNPGVDGVKQSGQPFSNTGPDGRVWKQSPGAAWALEQKQDFNHETDGTLAQLGSAQKPMSGFVASYLQRYPNASDAQIAQVMAYYAFGNNPADDSLPALHALARNFAVCDRWFSSMPGPTWQNRFFVHSGTCLGHIKMPSQQEPQNMQIYYQQTIFDLLSDANISWKIYHDGIPQSIVLTRLLTRYLTGRHYDPMETFFEDAQGPADSFPEYAFIEPRYFGANENDQHPPSDVRQGDRLIAQVYNALRANEELWNSTLLIVTYDEHGGFYDHVSPPACVPPDNYTAEWSFDRLGVRVPAILVSPWVQQGVVHTTFEHTSVLRYLAEKWNLAPLSRRMTDVAGALKVNSFGSELAKLGAPRTDTPAQLPVVNVLAARTKAVEPPIEGAREALLMYVQTLPEPGPDVTTTAARKAAAPKARQAARTAAPKAIAPSEDEAIEKLNRLKLSETEARLAAQTPLQTTVKPNKRLRKKGEKR